MLEYASVATWIVSNFFEGKYVHIIFVWLFDLLVF